MRLCFDSFDGHAHLHPTVEARDRLLQTMKVNRIVGAVVVPGGTLSPQQLSHQITSGEGSDVEARNEEVLALCEKSYGRLFPFYFANPHRGAREYATHGHRYYGLKLGPAVHGVPLSDPRTEALIVAAERFNHTVYLHCLARAGFDVPALAGLARRFPRVRFILGHAGIGNCDFLAISLIAPYANISLETSGGFTSVIDEALRTLGAERVLFGSEYPLQNPAVELEKMRCLDLPLRERQAVLHANIRKHIFREGRDA